MIKNYRMSWNTEKHSFKFVSNGNRCADLDELSDLIGSLTDLRDQIAEMDHSNDWPDGFKVKGSSYDTLIQEVV
jgi:hypothetical protein